MGERSIALENRRSDGLAADRTDPWESLGREVAGCTACPLHRSRRHVVVFRGSREARIVFVGEAPGAKEDELGVPFVGASGRRLDAAIARLGLGEREVGVLNLIKCRPAENRFDSAAARSCRPFLDRQLSLLHPDWIVPLGAHALAHFDPTAPSITIAAGIPREREARKLFPMLHPAAALHNPRLRERWDRDVRSFGDLLSSGRGQRL